MATVLAPPRACLVISLGRVNADSVLLRVSCRLLRCRQRGPGDKQCTLLVTFPPGPQPAFTPVLSPQADPFPRRRAPAGLQTSPDLPALHGHTCSVLGT